MFSLPNFAQATEYKEFWYAAYNYTSAHDEDPAVVCKTINVSTASTLYYNGAKFDPTISGLRPNNSGTFTCKDTDFPQSALHAIDIIKRCVTVDASGNATANSPNMCAPEPSFTCNTVGNPVNVGSLAKQEHAVDWVSPREPRFALERFYNSNTDGYSTIGYPTYYTGLMTNGGVWKNGFDSFIIQSPTLYRPADGRIIPLPTLNSATASKGGLPFKYSRPVSTQPYYWVEDGTGKRQKFQQYPGRTMLALVQIVWPDGYSIVIDRNPTSFAITAVSDNKGNRALFTSSGAVTNNAVNTFATKIEVDTNYNGTTFVPRVSLQYTYQDNIVVPGFPTLASVSRNNIEQSTSETIASYGYFDTTKYFPPLLVSVSTGARSSQFSYRVYGDAAASTSGPTSGWSFGVGKATSTSRAGGVGAYFLGTGQQTSSAKETKTINPLGLPTTYSFEKVDGNWMPTKVEGAAAAGCLSTVSTLNYMPNTGAPLGFVYSRTERNGSVTNYTRDARGLVLTQTEDAGGVSPRVTSYTWHATLRLPLTRTSSGLLETFVYTPEGLLTSYSQKDTKIGSPTNGQLRTWTYTYSTLTSGLKVLAAVDGPGLVADGVTDVTN